MKNDRLKKEDRKPFKLENDWFFRPKEIYWDDEANFNSGYLFIKRSCDAVASRESIGRKIGKHPTQIGRYESRGFNKQMPRLDALRKLIVILQMNPLKALNLKLRFVKKKIFKEGVSDPKLTNEELGLARDVMNWVKDVSDLDTRMELDQITNKISDYLGD